MKKLLTLLLAAVLLTLAVVPAFAASKTMYVNTPNGGTVNIRSGPGKQYEKWAPVKNGTKVTVLETKNGWSLCDVPGYSNPGYIMSKFLSKNKPSKKPVETHLSYNFTAVNPYKAMLMYPKSNYLNLRWAPSKTAKVIRRVFNGTTLTVMAVGKSWAQVYDDETGLVGFICIDYLVPVIQTENAVTDTAAGA